MTAVRLWVTALIFCAMMSACADVRPSVGPTPTGGAGGSIVLPTTAATPARFVAYPERVGEDRRCTETRREIATSPQAVRITTVSPVAIRPGVEVSVQAEGFVPGSDVKVWLGRPGTDIERRGLASGAANQLGAVSFAFTVPTDIAGSELVRAPLGRSVECLLIIVFSELPYHQLALVAYSEN